MLPAGGEEDQQGTAVGFPHFPGGVDAAHAAHVNIHKYNIIGIGNERSKKCLSAVEHIYLKFRMHFFGEGGEQSASCLSLRRRIIHQCKSHQIQRSSSVWEPHSRFMDSIAQILPNVIRA